MAISRRSMLRRLGALGATRILPAFAVSSLLGCRAKASPPFLRVLFEGPWVFSHDQNAGTLVATAPLDDMHTCMCGTWTANGPVSPTDGASPPLHLSQGARWKGSLTQSQSTPPDYDSVVGRAFRRSKAVYLKDGNYTVTPIPTDVQITLPLPDAAFVGGRLNDGSLSDSSSKKLDMMPHVAVLLKYVRPGSVSQVLNLVPDGDANSFSVIENEDLIFRMMHDPCPLQDADVDHVIKAFNELQKRVSNGKSNPGMTLSLKSTNSDCGSEPDSVNDSELGLGFSFPPQPCQSSASTSDNDAKSTASGIKPMNQTLANCAGGGIGVGP